VRYAHATKRCHAHQGAANFRNIVMSAYLGALPGATKCYVANGRYGPAFQFWLAVQRALDQTEMSLRELTEASGITRTTIARLKTSPARDRRKRREVVLRLAATLNAAARERNVEKPFPDEAEVLALAGLADPAGDDAVSVRDSVLRSTEYDDQQKQALLSLLDVLDRQRGDHMGHSA
jgi:hypothetical protein